MRRLSHKRLGAVLVLWVLAGWVAAQAAPSPEKPATTAPAATAPAGLPGAGGLVLPKAMAADDAVTQMLRQGQYQKALEETTKMLDASGGDMALRLYQRGLAKLGLAEAGGAAELYKSAGLDFMRVVTYFPRNTTWLGPCLVEAGYVHARIGRADLAAKLYERAESRIDADRDPELVARLEQLRAGLK